MRLLFLLVFFVTSVFADISFELHKDRVVHISTGKKIGTGVWLDSNYILTAQHVIDGCKSVQVDFNGISGSTYSVVSQSKTQDFAIIKSSKSSQFSKIAFGKLPKYGEWVFSWSIYDSVRNKNHQYVPVLDSGRVAAMNVVLDDNIQFLVSESVLLGASGSGVFNLNGELIGVLTGTRVDDEGEWYSTVSQIDSIKESYLNLNP